MSEIKVTIKSVDSPEDRGWTRRKAVTEWITKDGRTLKLEEIPDDHLVNIIRYVHRIGLPKTEETMMNEAKRRGLNEKEIL